MDDTIAFKRFKLPRMNVTMKLVRLRDGYPSLTASLEDINDIYETLGKVRTFYCSSFFDMHTTLSAEWEGAWKQAEWEGAWKQFNDFTMEKCRDEYCDYVETEPRKRMYGRQRLVAEMNLHQSNAGTEEWGRLRFHKPYRPDAVFEGDSSAYDMYFAYLDNLEHDLTTADTRLHCTAIDYTKTLDYSRFDNVQM